ncbi:MAG: LL-diaminopimelate aminotransferase [Phycisphaerae bacterium]
MFKLPPIPDRLAQLPPYLFVDIDRKKAEIIEKGADVIDFGIGDPDQPTPPFIVNSMRAAIEKPAYHRYPASRGSLAFRQAVAKFFAKRYGVTLDPKTEILALIGSKEGIGHFPLALLNPGDKALIPTPGYPVYESGTLFASGIPVDMPLAAERNWQPDWDTLEREDHSDKKLMFLNYPNNPTGASCTLDDLKRAAAFAKKNGIVFAHDAAYNEMYYADALPPSALQLDNVREYTIEFHSLSKTFNMTGWRIGFAVGNAELIDRLAKVKANLDSSQFTAIQEASIAALEGIDGPEIKQLRKMYRARRDALCPALEACGFQLSPPDATFYIWCKCPEGYQSLDVVNKLLEKAAIVSIPGSGFGKAGAGYVRFALTINEERIKEAAQRIKGLDW